MAKTVKKRSVKQVTANREASSRNAGNNRGWLQNRVDHLEQHIEEMEQFVKNNRSMVFKLGAVALTILVLAAFLTPFLPLILFVPLLWWGYRNR